jgi:uncharacterized protein YdeI (BOF family)
MKKLFTAMATMALALTLSAVSFAQQDQSAQPSAQPSTSDTQNTQQPTADQQGTQPQSSAPDQDSSNSMQANQPSSFSGTVVKAGGKYVLKTTDMSYQLDDQMKAKKYVGQQVKVSGSLDSNTSTIHVSDISPMS